MNESAGDLLAAARADLAHGWSVRAGTRLRQAAASGDAQAVEAFARAILDGKISGSTREARAGLEALDAPTNDARLLRASLRYSGTGGARTPDAALADVERAAEEGSAEAAIELALLTLETDDGEPAARGWLERAAQTSPLARRLLLLLGPERPSGSPRSKAEPQVLNAEPRILRFDAAFTPLECLWLQEAARPRLAPSLVADPQTGAARANPVRTSESMHFRPGVGGVLVRRLAARMARLADCDPACGEPLTLLRYTPGQEYKLHHDAFGAAALACDPMRGAGERVATVLAWLNRPEAGGATLFPRLGLRVDPVPGGALVFFNLDAAGAPAPLSLHAGEPVAAGEKWLASLWLRARPVTLG